MSTTETFTVTGTFTCPAGITSVDVEVWAAGGGGGATDQNNESATGGGGGAYSKKTSISVTPASTHTVTVGVGGTPGVDGVTTAGDGGNSWFSTTGTVFAEGGKHGNWNVDASSGGAGGSSANGVGTTKLSGGRGGNISSLFGSTGGGSSAGTASNGTNGGDVVTGASSGGAAPTGGGNGGDGDSTGGGAPAASGTAPGGGGGGKRNTSPGVTGGTGARGEVRVTYTTILTTTTTDTVTVTDSPSYLEKFMVTILETIAVSDLTTAIRDIWRGITRNTNTFVKAVKHTSAYSKLSKSISSWTDQTKN